MGRGRGTATHARGALCAAIAAATVLYACGGDNQSAPGTVAVIITDHRAAIDDFRDLEVTLDSLALHPRGRPRSEGWVVIPMTGSFDMKQLALGGTVEMGVAHAASGWYDAIELRLQPVHGVVAAEPPVSVDVAKDLGVQARHIRIGTDEALTLTFDLKVLDLRDHSGEGYALVLNDLVVSSE